MSFFRLYVDESGNHRYSKSERPEERYLCLNGCFFDLDYYEKVFQPEFESLKLRHFSRDVDDRHIVLHRKELIGREGVFSSLRESEKEKKFNTELLDLFEKAEYRIITVVIDKKSHFERWGELAAHPYDYCLLALIQRFVGFLNVFNHRGDVLAESRGKSEDMQLKSAYRKVYDGGTPFVDRAIFQKALSSKQIKLKTKQHNIAGLQVTDLLAYPCKQDVLIRNGCIEKYEGRFGEEIVKLVQKKYNRRLINNQIEGYGRVFIK